MHKFYTILILFNLSIDSYSQDHWYQINNNLRDERYHENDLSKNNLQGFVKSIRIKQTSGKDNYGVIIKDLEAESIKDLLSESNSETFKEFDEKGNIIREYSSISKSGIPQNEYKYQYKYEYNNEGKLSIKKKGRAEIWKYKYNSFGVLLEVFYENGMPNSYIKIFLKNGNKLNSIIDADTYSRIYYEAFNNVPPIKKDLIYDDKENLILIVEKDSTGSELSRYNYFYEKNKMKVSRYMSGRLVWEEEFIYDNQGRITEKNVVLSDLKNKYVYNRKNQISQVRVYSTYDGKLKSQADFEYDNQGNWVKIIIMEKKESPFSNDIRDKYNIVEREIIYY